ncbi:DEKNAAC104666 [Brettanomyces naardenensis]|uniref:Peroxisomal membrane protein PEX13 n=1 Tax=Brettanomyces naardenensis TaxID=13370 RepID=A0A448YRI9_BRENA|nr:DEKNAAC104666 [Brettanomyces naardenensis]
MSQARPKPWEVSSGTSGASVGLSAAGSAQTQQVAATTSGAGSLVGTSDSAPALPAKPEGLGNSATPNSDNNINNNGAIPNTYGTNDSTGYGSSMYGNSPYGSSLYGSGMYGSGMGIGSGMYGSGMYGSGMYGSGMYGSGMYGSGMGMYGSGNMGGLLSGNNFAGSLAQGTEATFQLIESFIGAVAGFSQMLESTYYATHNSFFTMMSMADQFSHLKDALGSVLGIYAVMGWVKKLLGKLRGKKTSGFSVDDFRNYQKRIQQGTSGSSDASSYKSPNDKNNSSRVSLKPLLFFLAAVFGMPYLLKKLVAIVAKQQQQRFIHQQQQNQKQGTLYSQARAGNLIGGPVEVPDPKKLEFARTMYNFNPENEDSELALQKGDLIAILSKVGPNGETSNWWRCRSRDGRIGFVPYNYLQVIKRAKNNEKIVSIEQATNEGEPVKTTSGKKISLNSV